MGTPYTGVAGNVSLAAAVQTTVPADGDADAAATFTVGMQKADDYLEALRQASVGSGVPINEGFESATFPPATPLSAWATPSPRFPSDSAWIRTTTGPLAGVASASAPTPQTLSTNSSLGLQVFLSSPATLQFVFAVTCNANNGDHLDLYVDGVLTAQLSSTAGPTAVAGTFYTDILSEGSHTFDWRFVRGGSASVGSEKCLVDAVQVISVDSWRRDPTRYFLDGEMGWGGPTTLGASTTVDNSVGTVLGYWWLLTGANAGAVLPVYQTFSPKVMMQLRAAAVAAGDYVKVAFGGTTNNWFTLAKSPLAQWLAGLVVTGANTILEVGLGTTINSGTQDFAGWVLDGSVSTTAWRCRTRTAGGVTTDIDPGIAFAAGTLYRVGVIASTVGGISSAVFVKDGKALAGTGGVPPISVTNLPALTGPLAQVRSVGAANAVQGTLERARFMALR